MPLRLNVSPGDAVTIESDGIRFFQSPADGLWSVATDWKDGWPTAWTHARPESVERSGDWTIVSGALRLREGEMRVRDAYRMEGGIWRGVRRWTWTGAEPLPRATLSIRWIVPGAVQARPLLPGVVIYGNPSGAKTGREAVIVHAGNPGDRTFVEEHRLSAPWISVEWGMKGEGVLAAALHTLPSPVAGGNQRDQWGSLGLISFSDATELAALSGPVAANGRPSVVKALQNGFLDYPDTWVLLRPGDVIEKTFWLEGIPHAVKGGGFRTPLRTALRIHAPGDPASLPRLDDIVQAKLRFAMSRFRDGPREPGFEMFPESVPGTHYVMGWCGQADTTGYAMLALAKRFGDAEMIRRGARSLDVLSRSPLDAKGFFVRYDAEAGRWEGQDPVSQGQGMEGFARAIQAGREIESVDTTPWETFLQRACEIHAARILRDDWKPVNTAEAFFISPLCQAHRLFGNADFLRAAIKAGTHYARRHLDMAEPYWGGTLDAKCEDKEGAWAAWQGFLALYEQTREPAFLDWAAHAMDVTLTYTVLWDVGLPAGRLRDHGLKTRGWTVVSAQNQHLDVYGVLYTPELWRMGGYLGRPELRRLAVVMYRTCGQLIDPYGSQGEQIQQTTFAQHGDLTDVFRMRGGYSESWTVLWITAHFLNAAAEFERMGVDLDSV